MRTKLISMRGIRVVPELAEALRELELALAKVGDVRLKVSSSDSTELFRAGRELVLELVSSKYSEKDCRLILWGCAIPVGFTPMDRYPNLNTDTNNVFHFIGEWSSYLSSLLSYGMGEYAWQNVCQVALLDTGMANPRNIEICYIQAQLARIGLYVGNIDGVISEQFHRALMTLGLDKKEHKEVIAILNEKQVSVPQSKEPLNGFITLPEVSFRVSSYGGVSTVQKRNGVEIIIEDSGRLVLDVSRK